MVARRATYSTTVLFVLLSGLLLGACRRSHEFKGTVFSPAAPASEIVAANYDGEVFRLSDHRGKVVTIFFGYTSCPDICPLTLSDLGTLYRNLGDKAKDLTVVFISVDPERDTQARIAQYVSAFNPDFYGLRAEGDDLETIKAGYGIFAEKENVGDKSAAGYLVTHTARVFVVDKAGNLRETFRYDVGVETMQPDIEYLLSE